MSPASRHIFSGNRVPRALAFQTARLSRSNTRRWHPSASSTVSKSVPTLLPSFLNDGETSKLNGDARNENAKSIRQSNLKRLQKASKLSLAPMMEYTDRHFRYLVRLISNETLLYTEMVAASTLTYERREKIQDHLDRNPDHDISQARAEYEDFYIRRFLEQSPDHASVLQLGGSSPEQMREAAEVVRDLTERGRCGYTAINLNCGCPSPKVAGKGCFGAALMDEPDLVAELCTAIDEGSGGELPVTVKCRIGTDMHRPFQKSEADNPELIETQYRELCKFIETIYEKSNGLVTDFSVHARIAVLSKSFSPADNRQIPPLQYEVVRRLVDDYGKDGLTFSLNGGIDTLSQVHEQFDLCHELHGCMVGRAWAADPWRFSTADVDLYGAPRNPARNRWEVLQAYSSYADAQEREWSAKFIRRFLTRAITPLFHGEPNSKQFRIALDEMARAAKRGDESTNIPLSELVLSAATKHLSEEVLFRSPEESACMRNGGTKSTGRSQAVQEWQTERQAGVAQ